MFMYYWPDWIILVGQTFTNINIYQDYLLCDFGEAEQTEPGPRQDSLPLSLVKR